jgi:hypothetical protein
MTQRNAAIRAGFGRPDGRRGRRRIGHDDRAEFSSIQATASALHCGWLCVGELVTDSRK